MQKLLSSAVIIFTVIAYSFAQQTVASDFYLMKTSKDAENVLKVINSEMHLSETEYTKLKDLLLVSQKSQAEQFAETPAPNAERTNVIKTRQTAHIESNLKAFVGSDKYNIYVRTKPAIEAKLIELRKN